MRIGIDARMCGEKQTGIGIYIENLIKNILKIDQENEYVLFLKNPSNELMNQLEKYNNTKIVSVKSSWYSYGEQLIFPFQILKQNLDLMHFPHFNIPVFCPVKFVVTIHDLTPKYFPGNKVGKSFFRRKMFDVVMSAALKKSEKIIAVSEFTKNEILKFFPDIPKDKIKIIYEGIREEFFWCHSRFYGNDNLISSFAPFIFYTGVWRNHKNLAGLIKAFAILKEKYKIPHKLVLGGSEDPNYPEVRNIWKELRLDEDIILTGFLNIEDQIKLYKDCDLYVQPSFSEGFGFTPLEVMACGTPTAISDIPAHREISGYLSAYFDPGNIENMAEKIYFALTDEEFREKAKSKGLAQAQKYNWENCAMETLKIYKQLAVSN